MNSEENFTEKRAVIDIIQLYKEFPCLWDISHNLYCNKDARNQAVEVLWEKWKEYFPNSSIKDVKKKIENLRAAYRRERNKVEASKTSGAGKDEMHTPSLWYYEHFSFLHEKTTPMTTVIDNIETSSSLSNNDEEPATKRERVTKKQQNNILKKQSDLLDSAKLLISGDCTSADAFGNSVSSQLKELTKVQRCLAEKLIGEVLFYAKLEVLTFEASINIKRRSEQYFSQQFAYQQQVPQASPLQFQPSPTPSPQHRQPSPSPQHHQLSPYAPSPSPQHRQSSPYPSSQSPQYHQPSTYASSQTPSPQHRQPSQYTPSPIPSPQYRQPSPSPKHSHTSPSQPSYLHCQPSPSPSPRLPPSPYQHDIVSPQITSDDSSSQPISLLDLPPIQLDSSSLINDYPTTSFELSSNQQQVFRGKAKDLNKYVIFKK